MANLVALGDSILEGWDGHEDVPRERTIPKTIAKINGWQASNKAIGGTQFGGKNSFVQLTAQTNFYAYDIVLVGYGVNDWCYPSGSLSVEQQYIEQGIQNIKNTNEQIPIVFELPTEDFRNGSTSLDDKNNRGWSQNDLCDLIAQVATEHGYQYFDWRHNPLITPGNHTTTLGDGQVHPTQDIMDKMAARLAPMLKSVYEQHNHNNSSNEEPSGNHPGDKPDDQPVTGDDVQLEMLANPFLVGSNLNANTEKVVSAINTIYQKVADLYSMTEDKVDLKVNYPTAPNRTLYKGVILTFLSLQETVNKLIKFCNEQGIVDMMTGKTDTITLDPPHLLTLDDAYQKQYNAQWQIIGEVLNKLLGYLKEMEGVE